MHTVATLTTAPISSDPHQSETHVRKHVAAIERVAEQRMAKGGSMHADLVRAAGAGRSQLGLRWVGVGKQSKL